MPIAFINISRAAFVRFYTNLAIGYYTVTTLNVKVCKYVVADVSLTQPDILR